MPAKRFTLTHDVETTTFMLAGVVEKSVPFTATLCHVMRLRWILGVIQFIVMKLNPFETILQESINCNEPRRVPTIEYVVQTIYRGI